MFKCDFVGDGVLVKADAETQAAFDSMKVSVSKPVATEMSRRADIAAKDAAIQAEVNKTQARKMRETSALIEAKAQQTDKTSGAQQAWQKAHDKWVVDCARKTMGTSKACPLPEPKLSDFASAAVVSPALESSALRQQKVDLEKGAAALETKAKAYGVVGSQAKAVKANLDNVLKGIGCGDMRYAREAMNGLGSILENEAKLTFDGRAIAGPGWMDAFRDAVRKGYDVPVPEGIDYRGARSNAYDTVGEGMATYSYASRDGIVGAKVAGGLAGRAASDPWFQLTDPGQKRPGCYTSVSDENAESFFSECTVSPAAAQSWADYCTQNFPAEEQSKCLDISSMSPKAPWTDDGLKERGLWMNVGSDDTGGGNWLDSLTSGIGSFFGSDAGRGALDLLGNSLANQQGQGGYPGYGGGRIPGAGYGNYPQQQGMGDVAKYALYGVAGIAIVIAAVLAAKGKD